MGTLILLLHVLGATIWTGGHLVLALTVLPRALRARDARVLREFEAGFERLALPALVVQGLSGLWLAHRLVPDPTRWIAFGSSFERLVGTKLVLLALTLALALHARLRLIPRLTGERLQVLAVHIALVTVVGVLFVVVGVTFRGGPP